MRSYFVYLSTINEFIVFVISICFAQFQRFFFLDKIYIEILMRLEKKSVHKYEEF